MRESWEQVRLMATYFSAPYREKGKANEKLFDLPWDYDTTAAKLPTPEDLERQRIKFAKWDAEMKEKANQNGQK